MVLRKQIILVFWSLSLAPTLSPALQAQGQSQESVNQHARILQDFEHRVEEYLKLRKTAEAGMPKLKSTDSPAMITQHERELASRIREARQQAKQGDIFTGTIVLEFRRLIGITMQGPEAAHIKQSLKSAEPVQLPLSVNDTYPSRVPLQSTPPTLLLNLPALPPEVEYRVVGHDLLLRDVGADLIVDFITAAIP
jgi:hypothetical protein